MPASPLNPCLCKTNINTMLSLYYLSNLTCGALFLENLEDRDQMSCPKQPAPRMRPAAPTGARNHAKKNNHGDAKEYPLCGIQRPSCAGGAPRLECCMQGGSRKTKAVACCNAARLHLPSRTQPASAAGTQGCKHLAAVPAPPPSASLTAPPPPARTAGPAARPRPCRSTLPAQPCAWGRRPRPWCAAGLA